MPSAGSFFLEQAKALAKQPELEVSILNWGQNEFQLQLRKPLQSMKRMFRYTQANKKSQLIEPELHELTIPHLSWTSRIAKGNIDALVNKINFQILPDIIHAHVSFPAGYLAMQLSRRFGIPYIITEHSGPFPFPEFIKHGDISSLISEPIANAAEVIAVSYSLASSIKEHTHVQAKVIPNMVNTDFFVPGLGSQSKDVLRLFCMSQMTIPKGAWELLNALRKLKDEGLDYCLYWAGNGNQKPKLLAKAMQYGLAKHVKFTGHLSRSQALYQYQQCDCLVMPSHIESFSIVLIEAMACGKPVIATDCGGPRDIVNDCNGILVPKRDASSLAKAIMDMNNELSCYNADKIREFCVSNYSPKVVCQSIENTYKHILNG
jgi:glycosyltransferase involved in cell wall biosynthesis